MISKIIVRGAPESGAFDVEIQVQFGQQGVYLMASRPGKDGFMAYLDFDDARELGALLLGNAESIIRTARRGR